MKFAIAFFLGLVIAVSLGTPAAAQAPLNGVYKSSDIGGTMDPGRYSESWTAASGALMAGNAINKMSWDGINLGAQWWMYCAQISGVPMLIQDTVDANGNGIKQYSVAYTGGIWILDGSGPWGGGDPSYTANMTSYNEIKTFHYANNVVFQVLSTVQLQAEVEMYNDCLTVTIANQEEHSNTDAGPMPANYPGFMDPNTCSATRTLGSWGEVDEFTMVITGTCTVPVEETTWSRLKAMYGNN